MTDPEQQATLLEQYCAVLAQDENARPPAGLDPGEAIIARRLHREIHGQKPTPAFRTRLRQQLEAEARFARTSASPRWAGRQNAAPQNAATSSPLPRLSSLFGRFVTALIIIGLLLGSIAVASDLIRRQQLHPGAQPTPTPTLMPTAAPTAQPTPCNGPPGSWHNAASLPGAATGGATASDGTYVYVAGGNFTLSGLKESNQLLRYDLAANKWTTLAPAPASFAAATAVYSPINKKLYVFGGAHGPTAAASNPFSDTRIYNPATNTWSSGAPMSDTRLLMAAGYWNGRIYLVAGLASLANPSTMTQTWEYDPLANTWANRAALPVRASGSSYGVINGHLYVVGGFDPTTGGFTNATYDFDIAADRWTTRASLPTAINYAGSAVVGNHLYVFGGIDNRSLMQPHTYVYDPTGDRWSSGSDMAQAWMLPGGASVGNSIVAVEGRSDSLLASAEIAAVSCQAAPPAPPSAGTPTPATTPLLLILTYSARIAGLKERVKMQNQNPTTSMSMPHLSGVLVRLASTAAIVALMIGSVSGLATRATAQTAPCNGPLGNWQTVAPLPGSMSGAAASDGTYVYVAGGTFTLSGLNESNQLLRYDPTANTWTSLAHAPSAFLAGNAVYSPINKKLYVFGGVKGTLTTNSSSFADTRIYDLASNSWSSGAPMPLAHAFMAAGYWNGKIYLVGGLTSLVTPSVTDQTWVYDPLANTWASRATSPAKVSGMGYGVINGHLYSAGGFDLGSMSFTTSTYDYDIAADTWTARADLPRAIDYPGSAVVGNHLYVFGGIYGNSAAEQNQSYVYDSTSNTWSNGPNMAQYRMIPAGASVGNTIFAIGGGARGSLLTSVEAATVSCEDATPTPAATSTPLPTATPVPAPTQTASTDHPYLFPQTGKTIGGKFRAYWENHGGLAQQGYPISNEFQEVSALDGKTYTVQYFERAVMELHPENAAPNDVLLSQLGTFRYKQKYPNGATGQTASTDHPYPFPQTGHTIGGKFRAYWESHGGLAQQGYPISDEFQEVSPLDGKTYTVQYFERAVFELHPENAGTAYEVELSQLGTFQYQQKYPIAP